MMTKPRRRLAAAAFRCGLLLAVPLCIVAGCGRKPPPHVILIVVDTLRADRLGAYGSQRGLTPFLDQLAHRGTVFRNAYAASSWTCPSVASLFTSRYPSQHKVIALDSRLPDSEVTLAEILAARGYVTLGFTANMLLGDSLGYAQGFREWKFDPSVVKLRAPELRERALSALDAARRPGVPVFLYLHFMEPHLPYDPPGEYRRRFERPVGSRLDSAEANRKVKDIEWDALSPAEIEHLESLYDGEVAYLDSELSRLFAELEQRDILRDAIVVLTADHGEEFGEHKLMSHGFSLYGQELNVPLLLLGPGVPVDRVEDVPASLVDVAPTLLSLAGLSREQRFEGRSLVPLEHGADDAVVIAQLPLSSSVDLRRHVAAVLRDRQKVLEIVPSWAAVLGKAEIYDLAADPAETRPLGYVDGPRALPDSDPTAVRAHALLGELTRVQGELAKRAVPNAERVKLGEEDRRRLRALGYVE